MLDTWNHGVQFVFTQFAFQACSSLVLVYSVQNHVNSKIFMKMNGTVILVEYTVPYRQ